MTGSRLHAAQPAKSGRDIYRQLCVKCHGRNGEGVKGKYDDHLQGDRSLENLTRFIDRKMPEDDPGKCAGDNAAAVARFIYDAFYSREARLRNHPARVELARLTNRQYLNSVADLLKHFTGTDAPPGSERGLKATYYKSRGFEKQAFERLDRQVAFDFNEGSDHEQLNGTNGFSIQWHGSVIADETGLYEFVLKTPNGARLWINDDTEPLIDAWVASGQVSEYKAAIRLIGGRVYPLKLQYNKYKEKPAAISLLWNPPRGALQPIPACNLCAANTSPTLVISTPFPPDDSSLGYERGILVSKAWDEAATAAAIEVANYVSQHLDRLAHTKSGDTNRSARIEAFCREFAATAWRRPLTPKDAATIAKLVGADVKRPNKPDKGEIKVSGPPHVGSYNPPPNGALEGSVKRVVLLTLESPRFLYLGLAGDKPDDFAVASRLSFDLWDSLPDAQLEKLAAKGELRTHEQIAGQARRMLNDPRARAKMQAFLQHWLQMDRIENLSKDDQVFPGFTPDIIADLRTSLNIFLDDVLWGNGRVAQASPPAGSAGVAPDAAGNPGGESHAEPAGGDARATGEGPSSYRTLLLADYVFLNNRLAQFYGVATNGTDDFVKVRLNPEQRAGVLTHPYLLAAFSYQKMTSPIHRGVFLTRNIVGRALRPPPMAMTFKDADFAPNLTMREKVSELTRPQACQTCHSVINPLGFSLEQYDAVGRFRTSDHDQPINYVSDYTAEDGQTIRLAGAHDVARFALTSPQAQEAFIEQLFHSLIKQPVLAYGSDALGRLREQFVANQFNLQTLIVDIVTLAASYGS